MRCDKCEGPRNSDCVTCSLALGVLLSTVTTYCECEFGYFPDPDTGECFRKSYSISI